MVCEFYTVCQFLLALPPAALSLGFIGRLWHYYTLSWEGCIPAASLARCSWHWRFIRVKTACNIGQSDRSIRKITVLIGGTVSLSCFTRRHLLTGEWGDISVMSALKFMYL